MNWYKWLVQKKAAWEEVLLIRQEKILVSWIQGKNPVIYDRILLSSPDREAVLQYDGAMWKKKHNLSVTGGPYRFVLCTTGSFSVVQKQYALLGEWRTIFCHHDFEVWESILYYQEKGQSVPLRLGMDKTEKKDISRMVREMMGEVLAGREARVLGLEAGRYDDIQDLDVAVWVEGQLRASVIVLGQPCRRALEIGARRATWDKRFSPLLPEELLRAHIEITFMSDLIFPVLESDWKRGDIDPTKGYYSKSVDGAKQGWYLPEVHNCVFFQSLGALFQQLTQEKSQMTHTESLGAFFGHFSVFDWIESSSGDIVTLAGPVPEQQEGDFSRTMMLALLEKSVQNLVILQESDGRIPALVHPKKIENGMRLPALGCSAHALAVYGRRFHDTDVLIAAEKTWEYLRRSLEGVFADELTRWFTRIYFFRLTLELGKDIGLSSVEQLLHVLASFRKNPILWLQSLSFLAEYGAKHPSYLNIVQAEVRLAYSVFLRERDRLSVQLALYPELIAICAKLFTLTGDNEWLTIGKECSQWYKAKQQRDNSWPHSPERIFSYTRGTAKIFEALACFPKENEDALVRAFLWLQSMQYHEKTLYHIRTEWQGRFFGGFRHDAFNRENWIDAAAHVILGLTRLLSDTESDELIR